MSGSWSCVGSFLAPDESIWLLRMCRALEGTCRSSQCQLLGKPLGKLGGSFRNRVMSSNWGNGLEWIYFSGMGEWKPAKLGCFVTWPNWASDPRITASDAAKASLPELMSIEQCQGPPSPQHLICRAASRGWHASGPVFAEIQGNFSSSIKTGNINPAQATQESTFLPAYGVSSDWKRRHTCLSQGSRSI